LSDIAIHVSGLSKLYKIGKLQRRHDTLRDRIADTRLLNLFKRRNGSASTGQVEGSVAASPHLPVPASDILWALKDVSFEVKRGEVVGIIGRNGAGKSTLLKILSRITEPTEGYADINGRIASLLEVGTGFHPELTGRENIFLNGSIMGMRRAEIVKKFDEIVAFSEVEQFIDTPVKHYSSGMYIRLAFAVAAHLDPEILLVDEVLAVGDAAFQKKCLGKMGDVAKEGRTVLFVSHNMGAVQSLCTKAFWIDHGEIMASGSPGDIVDLYIKQSASEGNESTRGRRKPTADRLRISALRILDHEGNQTETVSAGDSLSIEVDFESFSEVQNPIFLFLIRDKAGTPISLVSSFDSYGATPKISVGGTTKVLVKDINLLPGDYRIDVIVEIYGERLDWIEGAFHLSVVPSLFYSTGRFPPSGFGVVCFKCHWSMEYK
jgi:lipopolysaccharide transport system ATP-binding protein